MQWTSEWAASLRSKGLSEGTVLAYAGDVRRIAAALEGVPIESAPIEQLSNAFRRLQVEGLSIKTLRRMHSAMKSFFQFLEGTGRPPAVGPDSNLPLGEIAASRFARKRVTQGHSPRPYHARKFRELADPGFLRDKYLVSRMGTEEIAKEIGCTKQAVHKALRAHCIETRDSSQAWRASAGKDHTAIQDANPNLDETFFSCWSPASAYVLGVIFTDGSLHLSKRLSGEERQYCGAVTISQKEPELLSKVGALIGHSGRFHRRERRDSGNTVAGEVYVLSFSSATMIADLVWRGLQPRKSLTLRFPAMPKKLQRHFIRGCWDGDGSVFLERGRKLAASFVSGSQAFIVELLEVLHQQGVSCSQVYLDSRSKNPSYSIKVRGAASERLYDLLYHGIPESMYLSRKRLVFANFLGREPVGPIAPR